MSPSIAAGDGKAVHGGTGLFRPGRRSLTAAGACDSAGASNMAESTFTSADFHNVVQKQILNAV